MKFFKKTIPEKYIALWEAVVVVSGICLFAIFIHKDSWGQLFSFLGLIIAGFIISRSVSNFSSLMGLTGLIPLRRGLISFIIAGILFGGFLGLLYNYYYSDSLLPASLTKFAMIAPLIGIMEELVFRGIVQTRAAVLGAWFSIVLASFGHTLYKYLVINTLPGDLGFDYPRLIVFTFLVGIVMGVLRNYSKSVLPAASAHALFDIVVYGSALTAPAWIWG